MTWSGYAAMSRRAPSGIESHDFVDVAMGAEEQATTVVISSTYSAKRLLLIALVEVDVVLLYAVS